MLLGLLPFWIVCTKQILVCEALCDEVGSCIPESDKYSLADMSHIPRHRRLKQPSSKSQEEQSVLHRDVSFNTGENEEQMEGNSLTFPTGDVSSVDEIAAATRHMVGRMSRGQKQPDVNHLASDENARPLNDVNFIAGLGDLNVMAETMLELSRGLTDRHGDGDDDDDEKQGENDDDDHHHQNGTGLNNDDHHHQNGTGLNDNADEKQGEDDDNDYQHQNETVVKAPECEDNEHPRHKHCYFLTKESIPGYRSSTECAKQYPGAKFAAIKDDEENEAISKYVKQRLQRISKELIYVYIKYDKESKYGADRFNAKETKFKHYVCDMVGCHCTALRSTTGSWHSRMCATRHQALCRRRRLKPTVQKDYIAADTSDASGDGESAGTRGAAAPSLLLLLLLSLSMMFRLLSAVR